MQSGQNAPVSTGALTLNVTAQPQASASSLDLNLFLLDAAGRVISDDGFIFYGHCSARQDGIELNAADHSARCEPARLRASIQRVVIALSIDTDVAGVRTFSQFSEIRLRVAGGETDLVFAIPTSGMTESSLILGELYLRNGIWKLRALGQGFAGGLAPLASHFGVEIADTPPPSPAPPPPAAAKPRPTPAPTPPPAPRAPSRINLEKRKPISLEKPSQGFEEINVNLNWTSGAKRGLFGGTKGGIDLDLGCMLEMANGEKTVIQALGGNFGDLNRAPFVKLLGDDRTGADVAGETLLINGRQWSHLRRVLIYSFIYEGAPNWAAANAVVTIVAPGSPKLVVELDEHASKKGMCGIALLENDAGRIRVTKIVDYFGGHKQLDNAFGFGFNWVAGQK